MVKDLLLKGYIKGTFSEGRRISNLERSVKLISFRWLRSHLPEIVLMLMSSQSLSWVNLYFNGEYS